MNEAVLEAVEQHALTPEAIEQVIQLTELDERKEQQVVLEREQADVVRRIDRILEAIENGQNTVSNVDRLKGLDARKKASVTSSQPSSLCRGFRPKSWRRVWVNGAGCCAVA